MGILILSMWTMGRRSVPCSAKPNSMKIFYYICLSFFIDCCSVEVRSSEVFYCVERKLSDGREGISDVLKIYQATSLHSVLSRLIICKCQLTIM